MKHLAVAIALVVVALCTTAFGTDPTQFNNGAKLMLKREPTASSTLTTTMER